MPSEQNPRKGGIPAKRTLQGRLARRLLRCPDPTSDDWKLVYETADGTCWWHSDYEITVVCIKEIDGWRSAVRPHGGDENEAEIRLTPNPASRKTAEYLCVQYMDHGIAPVRSGTDYKSLLPPRWSREEGQTDAE